MIDTHLLKKFSYQPLENQNNFESSYFIDQTFELFRLTRLIDIIPPLQTFTTSLPPSLPPIYHYCILKDFYGGDNTRITSYGRRKREVKSPMEGWRWTTGWNTVKNIGRYRRKAEPTVTTGEEVLVTHAFRISDTFTKKKSQSKEERPSVRRPNYSKEESFSYSEEHANLEEEVTFDPAVLEVCVNVTGLIAGVAVFLIIQLGLVFLWTHFWHSRNRKKGREEVSSLR